MKYETRSGQPVIAGNWKMHKGPSATRDYFAQFTQLLPPRNERMVLFFPPDVSLTTARATLRDRTDLWLGVQNIHWQAEGAYTGETSAPLARDAGATHTLVGHSERRHLFGETDDEVRQKVSAAIRYGLVPLVCVGETLEERTADQVESVITRQLEAALNGVPTGYDGELMIAYEPVWAIGTGVTATPADASVAHLILRALLTERLGASVIPILYGGSVKPENAQDLLAADAVDGLLVGGASLDPAAFAQIATAG
jgi:triosephosphate isomerase